MSNPTTRFFSNNTILSSNNTSNNTCAIYPHTWRDEPEPPTRQEPRYSKGSGRTRPFENSSEAERVCVHIEGKHALSDLFGRLMGIARKFQQHFQQHNHLKITGISSLSVLPSRASKTTPHHSTSGCLTAPFPAKASTAALLPSHPSAPSAKSSRYHEDQSAP